mgnify:FL=1|tara:strand:+ start:1431 stop:1751 length:321 start_codon:yes stop_codon:yes gene_type:complete
MSDKFPWKGHHEFTMSEVDGDGLFPLPENLIMDIVGAELKFYFNDGQLECKVLYASFDGRGRYCPLDSTVECTGCTCLVTDKGEVMMCKKTNKFLRIKTKGDDNNE